MRLIATFSDTKKAQALANYLTKKGIENELDVVFDTAWESSHYGESKCRLWVIDEEQLEKANQLILDFDEKEEETPPPPPKIERKPFKVKGSRTKRQLPKKIPYGNLTLGLFFTCLMLFLATSATRPETKEIPSYLPHEPFLTSPISKELLFDYPESLTLIDQAVKLFGKTSLFYPKELPKEALTLLQLSLNTPYWQGAYELVVNHFQVGAPLWPIKTPLFEKIQEGEFWRLWTPCLLHADMLHLLFNMIWLIVIGNQLELKLGKVRYLLFILLTAPIANIAQYLMTGYNFVGFSGVLCAMLAFIWIRQRKAPWEGYQLDRATIASVIAFVLGMLGLQILAFFAQSFFSAAFSLPIANTAHLTGAIMGYFLGKSRYFASLL